MHAPSVLQTWLHQAMPALHQKRLAALAAAVDGALTRRRLTLCEVARGLPATCSVRHRIKRADRLLGNRALHGQRLALYQFLCHRLVGRTPEPVVLVDWSDLKAGREWLVLRAAVWMHGFALPIYEEVHPLCRQASPRVERAFLRTLQRLLGDGVRPILITDAGFRAPWFRQVERRGWHWVGRIRGRTFVQSADGCWQRCRALFAQATATPQDLGVRRFVRARPVTGRLCLYHRPPQGRSGEHYPGRRPRNGREKCAAREREPWLLAASRSLEGRTTPLDVVNLYRIRMRIEQSFRMLKSHQFGFSFEDCQSHGAPRLQMLLVIHALALFLLWIAGRIADRRNLRSAFESNARRSRTTISIVTLGWLALSERAVYLTDQVTRWTVAPPGLCWTLPRNAAATSK